MTRTLGALLEARRTELRERQLDTAARFRISQPSYWRWENDEGFPNDTHFEGVAEFLGIEVEDIYALQQGRARARGGKTPDDWQADMTDWRREIDETLRWQRSQLSRIERAIADLVSESRWSDRTSAQCQCACHLCDCCGDDAGPAVRTGPRSPRGPLSPRR